MYIPQGQYLFICMKLNARFKQRTWRGEGIAETESVKHIFIAVIMIISQLEDSFSKSVTAK